MDELRAVLLHLARFGAARHAAELDHLEGLIRKALPVGDPADDPVNDEGKGAGDVPQS